MKNRYILLTALALACFGLLPTQLKEQAAQIQKVSTQLEVSKPAPQMVVAIPQRLED